MMVSAGKPAVPRSGGDPRRKHVTRTIGDDNIESRRRSNLDGVVMWRLAIF
jgi:hypothetical protein